MSEPSSRALLDRLLPLPAGVCTVCGRNHEPDLPHDAESLYYRHSFQVAHGRWPTWADACAHTPLQVRMFWKTELSELGAWTEPDGKPIAQPYTTE
jgi:hypothetical protein